MAPAPRRRKSDSASGLERLAAVVAMAATAETTSREQYERAVATHCRVRDEYARLNAIRAVTGGEYHAGFLRSYCLCEPLWGMVGHAAYFGVAPGCRTMDNDAGWLAVFRAVVAHQGW